MGMQGDSGSRLDRRQLMGFLGAALGFSVVPRLRSEIGLASPIQTATGGRPLTGVPEGAIIRTILRDLPPEALGSGAALFHEHMSMSNAFFEKLTEGMPAATAARLFDPSKPFFMEDFDLMLAEMRAASDDGIACIVDGGVAGHGRSVEFLRRLSQESGMAIVVSGGYYTQVTYPPEVAQSSEDEIAEGLVRDANAERWGAFGEIGTSQEITLDEHKVFRAVAKAHLRTNLPIFTHTANGRAALSQLDIFESLGVEPQRVVIGHVGGVQDPQARLLKTIAERGAYVGFDRVGGGPEVDARKVPMVMALIEAGYADNVVLSSDFNTDVRTLEGLKTKGGPGYAKPATRFAPMLRSAGVDQETVQRILVDNPRRFLAFVPRGK